ncbi:DUF4270 domain-containing protein [Algibacter amylolyticus]|uniref:DUF4270 domain-containing protein n=1 Tax=Algibacter amylolyticus TaxID=1608400 RepID=A0A5M7B0X1_9FLAO|nr:DUF4270 family protein [Algibacter amylolyticus]KAA5823343.1 DUF4270 domain-containing protein [Algibacter amylolyticus]MBB5267486.1 hypothetical protein [Algibacter amylolyticus]TSJ73831.1 DUF4270 domain-containing protein [Algibacter amylolyticus]
MKLFLISVFSLLFMFSCSEEVNNYPVGTDFIDNDINIVIVDTFSIKAATYKIDSLITSGTSRMLLGHLKDEYLGNLTAQTYFQVNNSDFSISTNAVYDSIGLVLNYDTYYYGDTLQPQTYKVHRLLEFFEPVEDDDFYNTSKLKYDEEALGEVTFTPRPNSATDSIYIALNTNIGEEIFNKIRDNEINTTDDFVQYFNGLTVIPDATTNSHVLGFNFKSYSDLIDNTSMRIFYTENISDSSEGNDQVIDFFIPNTSMQFNSISANLDNTTISGLSTTGTTISSDDTNQLIFAQAGTGISARIEMPTVKDLKSLSNESAALNAELTFKPLKGSYDASKPLKESLLVYVVDGQNRIVSQLTDLDSNASLAVLNQADNEFDENTYYSIDMSGFVEMIWNSEFDLDYAIMIQFEDYNSVVDALIIDNLNENNDNIKLSVTYLNY